MVWSVPWANLTIVNHLSIAPKGFELSLFLYKEVAWAELLLLCRGQPSGSPWENAKPDRFKNDVTSVYPRAMRDAELGKMEIYGGRSG
jgi:hypothetical protein